jgi:chemotaxis family two-component system sensor kinase Cph1
MCHAIDPRIPQPLVTILGGPLPPGEQERLDACVLEPIRTPGSVQSHGVLLAVDAASSTITHASENSGALFGIEASDLLGWSLADITGPDSLVAFADILADSTGAANPLPVLVEGRAFEAIVHTSGRTLVVEFEPSATPGSSLFSSQLYSAMHRLARATTDVELWSSAARELRRLTWFDHVMIYRFHPDGHGEVVGENLADGMESFLGLHYPESDVPAQARELYLTKLSRVIVSSSDLGSPILTDAGATAAADLDLSRAELRSVSPHHLRFMRNMGQAASLSLSLIHDGVLIGMITCAHRTPRRIPFALRQGLEIMANQVALQLSSMNEIRRLTRRAELRSIRSALVAQLTDNRDMGDALLYDTLTMLDLIPADGAMISHRGRVTSLGIIPTTSQVTQLVSRLEASTGRLELVTRSLALEHPELAEAVPLVAGIILLPLGGEGDYIAWFRREIANSVNWLGDQTASNRATTLSPRTSFSSWTRSVHGTSRPWDGLELEAEELCRDLGSALLRRAESKLASLALRDPLTGLPNRRLLMDRLEHSLTRYARGEELSLLFIDLDGFKAVNDSYGHEVGDAVLVHVGIQLLAATRAQDTVARIGGDEFVVLCENTTPEECDVVASRIADGLRQSAVVLGTPVSVTVSIGIAAANLTFSATELLRAADAAMYRAKARGRDQISR